MELKKAVNRGIKIYIGYGWQYPSGQNQQSSREIEALKLIDDVNETNKGMGKIICKKFPNHSKILLCDSQYAICGSANWLSNTGYHNREVSVKITDQKIINELLFEASEDFIEYN